LFFSLQHFHEKESRLERFSLLSPRRFVVFVLASVFTWVPDQSQHDGCISRVPRPVRGQYGEGEEEEEPFAAINLKASEWRGISLFD